MPGSFVSDKYVVVEVVSTNVNVAIYRCLDPLKDQDSHYRIHQVKDRGLIKYYLNCVNHLSATLPFIESFVAFGDLYLVFKDYSDEPAIHHHQFSDADRKAFILKLLAKLSLDSTLPNFIKYTLIKSDNIRVDKNRNLHFNVTLDLLNPSSFEYFKSVQKKVADLIETLTEEYDEFTQFITACEEGRYKDYVRMLADYKYYMGTVNEYKEPWIYEKLLEIFLWVKSHFRLLMYFSLLSIFIIYGITMISSSATDANKPYVKDFIGIVHYDDPYNELVGETETVSVYVPQMNTAPTSVEPQTEMTNEYTLYIVPPGDYLYKISFETYGDRKYAHTLAAFNGLEDPNFLPVNYPLKLPIPEQIETLYEIMGKP